jgi:subtilisin family serine protease
MRAQWNIASLCVLALVIGVLVIPSPALALEGESTYIVQVAPGNQEAVAAQIKDIGGVVTSVLDDALDGLIVTLTPAEASIVARETTNTSISPAQPLQLMNTQDTTGGLGGPILWNLSRLDQASPPVDGSYTYPAGAGSGIVAYVVDTGITATNPDFAGHVATGLNFASDKPANDTDDCGTGHGTHVAGTIGSKTYGVAKAVTLVPVRVFDCAGAGDSAQLIAALDWIMKDLARWPAGTRKVVNMSLGVVDGTGAPARNFALDTAVQNLTAENIVVAVAAGNANANACNGSPGAVPSALTVGATNETDTRVTTSKPNVGSNFGSCLDLFAPGAGIWSLTWNNSTMPTEMTGTSMAAPHIAGIAALALAANPSLTVAQVSSQIINNAVTDKISNPGTSSPNRLANMSWLNSPATTSTPAPTTTSRLSGSDRYATSEQISRNFNPGVPVVYVATGENYPDALSAGPAATVQSSPLLLTDPAYLPFSTQSEIQRLKPALIVVVGGEGAISSSVYARLSLLAPAIRRDSGADRFSTSRIIAERAFGSSGANVAFIATGNDFPDALAAAAAAGSLNAPVILLDGSASSADPNATALMRRLGVTQVYIAGGPGVVTVGIQNSLSAVFSNVTRLSGTDRYATSRAINAQIFSSSAKTFLAVGTDFPDSLSGAALAGRNRAPLYIVPRNCVPGDVLVDIDRFATTDVVLLGGTGALTEDVSRLQAC